MFRSRIGLDSLYAAWRNGCQHPNFVRVEGKTWSHQELNLVKIWKLTFISSCNIRLWGFFSPFVREFYQLPFLTLSTIFSSPFFSFSLWLLFWESALDFSSFFFFLRSFHTFFLVFSPFPSTQPTHQSFATMNFLLHHLPSPITKILKFRAQSGISFATL